MGAHRALPSGSRQSIWDSIALLEAFAAHNIKPVNAVKLWSYLIRHPAASWNDIPDLPKAAKQLLDAQFAKFVTRVLRCQTSSDGETTKLLIALQDGQQVESVIMHYDTRATYEDASEDSARHSQPRRPHDPSAHTTAPTHRDSATHHQSDRSDSDDQLSEIEYHSCDEDDNIEISTHDRHTAEASTHEGRHTADRSTHGSHVGGETQFANGARQAADSAAVSTASDRESGHGQDPPQCGTSTLTSSVCEDTEGEGCVAEGSQRSRDARRTRRHGRSRTADTAGGAVVRGMKRSTLCVSSQVGCQMGCTFCATGTMGLRGNLTAGEIVEQLVHASAVSRVRNIVFMGMGEPLANYEPVRAAVRTMTDSRLFALCRRHVTISTVGVIPRIKQLAQDLPGISLALSLHAPTQELRATIVPSARAYPLEKLMAAVRQYEIDSNQRVFMEYVVLSGVNDSPAEAHALGALLQGHNSVLNLIPWNPVLAAADSEGKAPAPMRFAAPDMSDVAAFQSILKDKYGIPTTVRQEKGQDIAGACGQLVIQQGQAAAAAATAAAAAAAAVSQRPEASCGSATAVSDSGCGGSTAGRDRVVGVAAAKRGTSALVRDIEELGA